MLWVLAVVINPRCHQPVVFLLTLISLIKDV